MNNRKSIFILIALLCSLKMVAQNNNDITGLWKGTLYNDSNKLTYNYEIAISSFNGKMSGFSHTWFILDGKQYYGVKKVKVRRMKEKIIVEDDGLIANNYPVKPAKHVRQINIFDYKEDGATSSLEGPFTTNRTKQYTPLTGFVKLQRTNNYQQTSLVPHLEELSLAKELSFIPPSNPTTEGTRELTKEVVKTDKPVKPSTTKEQTPIKLSVTERKNNIQHTTYYASDSLHLTLYDNGEVDGDSVSVYMNGVQLLSKIRLSTVPVTLSVPTHGIETIQLVMFAESLGTIPPNTGLMVVRDGKNIHEIRFSSNFYENAELVFKRKNP